MQQGKSLLLEINRIRMNPQGTIFDLRQQIARFDGPHTVLTSNGQRLKVSEGKYVWTDAIIFLEQCQSKDPLVWCEPLAYIANEYQNQTKNGKEVSPFQLLKQRYQYNGNISFNVSQSQAEQSMREIVLSMIVDDGDTSRGNRTTVTQTKYTHFGGFVTKRGKVTIAVMFFSDTADFKLKLPGSVPQTNTKTSSSVTPNTQQMLDTGRELIYELNDIRRDPKRLIPQLKADLNKFKPDGSISKNGYSFATKQGKVAFLDLITELQEMNSLNHILRSDGLSIAAVEQVSDLDRQSRLSSVITNKGSCVNKYTNVTENSSNFIANKQDNDPIIDILIFALVDDGDKTRSIRRKLLNPQMKYIGAAVGQKFFGINVAEKCEDNRKEINLFLEYSNKDGREKPSYPLGKEKIEDRVTFGVEDKYGAASISTTVPTYTPTYTPTNPTTNPVNAYTSSYHPSPDISSSTNTISSSTSYSNVTNSKLGSSNPYTYGSTVYQQRQESPRFKEPQKGTNNKVIAKKTTKSSTSSRNGRTYKKIITKIQYQDGTISEEEEEEIVN